MSDKERAKKEVIRAVAATEPVKQAKKAVERKLTEQAEILLSDLGIEKKQAERAMALAKMIKDQKISASTNLGKNTKLSGEADFKNKSYQVKLTHEF